MRSMLRRMSTQILVYGAYGYTGELVVRRAVELGLTPTLAGRNPDKTRALAERHHLEHRSFGLDDPSALRAGLDGIEVVLHCAGPFAQTSKPMVEACLATQTHYLDITGEMTVFERCAAQAGKAEDAGIMLMPGVGFDVVPSDCLAAHLASQLPDADHLQLGFRGLGGGLSHGTATTMVQNLGAPNFIRRGGQLTPVPLGAHTREIDFGRGPTHCMAIAWGDVSTAWYSTKIPNIEVYVPVSRSATLAARIGGMLPKLMGSSLVKRVAQRRVDAAPPGPSDAQRERSKSILWGRVSGPEGAALEARLETPEGYTLTAMTAVEIAKRTLAGAAEPGFRTPSMVFGADFILDFDGVSRS